ncbi:VQ motif-containing protein 11-like [Andrographis paniculata]|uniref:VQ motif-containing protein 11-like n=1 Tax=Andrographis paniculata TaxID=175694 RepID=UPI0021E8CF47|nr:VQ motif-containing protein 11-like [Andrographis paniculata]
MASSGSNHNPSRPFFPPAFHSSDVATSVPNTTFVQADPSTFRAVVQRLTGASPAKAAAAKSSEIGPRRPAFKLHERRPTARKLEIKLGGGALARVAGESTASPVSPLEYLAARGSPRTPMEEEERAIAEKGFYLHPSPLSTPVGSDPPELLPLFPLHSPMAHDGDGDHDSHHRYNNIFINKNF